MCSIFGWVGPHGTIDEDLFHDMRTAAGERGRDGGRVEDYRFDDGWAARLGSWRAAPTTEVQVTPLQPYDGIVHNGTIANDRELGNPPGRVDSMILPQVLKRTDLTEFTNSVKRIKGSYALAAVSYSSRSVFVAVNYKPLYYVQHNGGTYFASMEHYLECFEEAPRKVPPYSTLNMRALTAFSLWEKPLRKMRALVICSSGLDSTTVAYMLRAEGCDVDLLHFKYGAAAEYMETQRVMAIARHLECMARFETISTQGFKSPLTIPGSPISGGVEGAEYAHEWVPARNLVMLAHAAAIAECYHYDYIALGNNLEESGAYPDNEEEFTTLFNKLLPHATQNGVRIQCISPVGNLMKHEIVRAGTKLRVPYELTWSCYNGRDLHCGKCGPCFMRRTAFERNGLVDPVAYEK